MTREDMWKEFENQLIRETRTPITMSFENAEKLTKLGIEETVAKWKKRLEQTDWIPVSERLPEKDGRFLTYIENPYDIQLSYVMVCDYIRQTWCPDDETASSNVVAWMPLPELYKTESEVQDADSDGDRR